MLVIWQEVLLFLVDIDSPEGLPDQISDSLAFLFAVKQLQKVLAFRQVAFFQVGQSQLDQNAVVENLNFIILSLHRVWQIIHLKNIFCL